MAKDPSSDSTILRRIVVEQGLATAEEVDAALAAARRLDAAAPPLAELLVRQGLVTPGQLERVRLQADVQKTGQQIPGYRVLEKLGSGAMSSVFKARQLSLDRMVAIKVLPRKLTADPVFVQRFYAEGRAAARLNHPNIVQAYDVGQSGEFHYFIMEYVEGHTVHEHLQKHGRYEPATALKIIIQVAEALTHAHDAGFIHRDVKPKNIIITTSGDAKLADMGLARSISDKEAAESEAGRAYGTPYYISPEQIRGRRDIDWRADIYSLGATFYHMVTGRVPFDAPNPSAVMHRHLRDPLEAPDHLNPELTADASQVIRVMLAKRRTQRYPSTFELLEDLRDVAAGRPPLHARQMLDAADLDCEASTDGPVPSPLRGFAAQSEAVTASPAPPPRRRWLWWIAAASIALNLVLLIVLALR